VSEGNIWAIATVLILMGASSRPLGPSKGPFFLELEDAILGGLLFVQCGEGLGHNAVTDWLRPIVLLQWSERASLHPSQRN
jgi:hypothetical protein